MDFPLNANLIRPRRKVGRIIAAGGFQLMPQHWVKFALPSRELGNSDISFEVYRDSKKFGELRISRAAPSSGTHVAKAVRTSLTGRGSTK